jgi:hypothetical protein
MIERNITLPEMILWTGTRVALGAGIGMLISRRLSKDAMKAAGLALTVVGGFTTIPLAISIMGRKNSSFQFTAPISQDDRAPTENSRS